MLMIFQLWTTVCAMRMLPVTCHFSKLDSVFFFFFFLARFALSNGKISKLNADLISAVVMQISLSIKLRVMDAEINIVRLNVF